MDLRAKPDDALAGVVIDQAAVSGKHAQITFQVRCLKQNSAPVAAGVSR
jgi:hypothetical protein